MTDHIYAGHTLAEIKAAAEAATPGPWEALSNIVRTDMRTSHGFLVTACPASIGNRLNDASHIATANPATVLAMAERIEYLESAWHVEIIERKDAIIAKQENHNDELKARITELERELDAERLQGWQAAREQAATVSDNLPARWDGNVGMMLTKDMSARIRAMQPPAEWGGHFNHLLNIVSAAWPHPDGFAGGLTERTENGQDQESQSQP